MANLEEAVERHYAGPDLLARILAGLEAAGIDKDNLQPDDLAPVDEFHVGGRKATQYAVAKMALSGSEHVLDIGCGIGGPARYIASSTGCRVTGIDLTTDYIEVATSLTNMTGQADKAVFHVANALDMSFESATFDAAVTFHVAMNIPDRVSLYAEIARVMKPGATLCTYDLMRTSDGELAYPVPWAETAATSHLTTPEETANMMKDAGFEINEVEDRTDPAIEFFNQALAAMSKVPTPLGIHLLMGPTAPDKFANVRSNIVNGLIAPVVIVATRIQVQRI